MAAPLHYAVNLPNGGADTYADPATLAALCQEAEEAGWDGFFLWDHVLLAAEGPPVVDPWIALAAAAAATSRIRLGPVVTAVPRRRPWKLAREAVSLDHLSGGRLTLGVGLGFPAEVELAPFGEETDLTVRARMLDEGLAVIDGLWTGRPFSFAGEHYRLAEVTFRPSPLQRPRIPIWVGGTWPAAGHSGARRAGTGRSPSGSAGERRRRPSSWTSSDSCAMRARSSILSTWSSRVRRTRPTPRRPPTR